MPLYGQSGYGQGRYGIADSTAIYTLGVGYYLALITSQYQICSMFLSWLQGYLQKYDDVANVVATYEGEFDIDAARGVQLDTLGLIVGVGRLVPFQPTGIVSPLLDDDTYRILIKAQIARNHWDGRINSLQDIWAQLFPSGRIIINDNQNMTATVIVSGTFSSILQDLISNGFIVPRPETVEYTYDFGILPLFGFDRDDAFIAGFDIGHWS